MTSLVDKVALVTGATRGIGKGIAIGLGESGATVYITGRSLESSLAEDGITGTLLETKQQVEEAGGVCIPIQCDHSDDEQIKALFERIADEQNGQLDILVNNVYAGVQSLRDNMGKPFWQCDVSLWDDINQVGLRSHYVSSVFASRLMVKQQEGLIVTISSWGSLSHIFGTAYGVGKTACDRLSADMAVELKKDNITCISLWPGIVGTQHITKLATQQQNNDNNMNLGDGYNWETPLLTGRVIAALAKQENVIKYTGKMQIVAELAEKYQLTDKDGNKPASARSLKFILPFAIPQLKNIANFIPNWKIPWFILLWLALQSPKI